MNAIRRDAAATRSNEAARHTYLADYDNADQAEWQAVLHGQAHVSGGTHDDSMAQTELDHAGVAPEQALHLEVEQADEALQGAVLEVITERQALLGINYPFELEGNSLVLRAGVDGDNVYLGLLAITAMPSLNKSPYNDAPIAFEHLSLLAARFYLGTNAKGWRFGWPREGDEKALTRMQAAISHLKALAGDHPNDWHWRPAPSSNTAQRISQIKDCGLDVVAWVPWPDGGPGQLHLLGQCACGEDWKQKLDDLSIKRLNHWMKLPEPEPLRAFFTPRHMPLPFFEEVSRDAGLTFDRVRMVQAIARDVGARTEAAPMARSLVELGRLAFSSKPVQTSKAASLHKTSTATA
jgi:hypothetical protein